MNQPKNWWKTIEIRNLGTTEGEDIFIKNSKNNHVCYVYNLKHIV